MAEAPRVDAARPAREVAPGVWVIEDRRVPLVPNVGLVEGRDAVLVVDTGLGPENGRRVLEVARRVAGGRRLILTTTHFHPEHAYGASAFTSAAEWVCNRAQAEELAAKGEGYLSLFRGMSPEVAAALEGTELRAPTGCMTGTSTFLTSAAGQRFSGHGGRRTPGATKSSRSPMQGVLFTGDLAEERIFPIFPWFPPNDADIDAANWIAVLSGWRRRGRQWWSPGMARWATPVSCAR
jgi:glyoxylase-like metal-dependent hydrolase (beta-lactamase superfamily II)